MAMRRWLGGRATWSASGRSSTIRAKTQDDSRQTFARTSPGAQRVLGSPLVQATHGRLAREQIQSTRRRM